MYLGFFLFEEFRCWFIDFCLFLVVVFWGGGGDGLFFSIFGLMFRRWCRFWWL